MCIATTVRDGVAIGNKGQAGSPAAVREHTMLVVVVREHMRNSCSLLYCTVQGVPENGA